jgi:hypothetical protein
MGKYLNKTRKYASKTRKAVSPRADKGKKQLGKQIRKRI